MLLGFLITVHIIVCIALIGVILLQKSEGGALGMGGGGGGFVSARGAANLLTRATAVLATLFFVLSLTLTLVGGGRTSSSVTDRLDIESLDTSRLGPAAPGATPGSTAPATTGLPVAPGSVTPASPGIGAEDSGVVTAPPATLEAPRPTLGAPTAPATAPAALPDATTTPPAQ